MYYDVFTRNAFGSAFNILKEISYSAIMGDFLTFRGNRAYESAGSYPDENYARELLQLFTIGLVELNIDGSAKLDNAGNEIPTFDNSDIATFARVWTGLNCNTYRLNFEGVVLGRENGIDPMKIKPLHHDRFPKTKLGSGYLGDQVAPCTDYSQGNFLVKGARFRFLGAKSLEGSYDTDYWFSRWGGGRFQPPPESALYQALCAPAGEGGACTFPLDVVLTEALPCDAENDWTCGVDHAQNVKMVEGDNVVWYEWIRPKCVRMTFMEQGYWTKASYFLDTPKLQCADAALPVAAGFCCKPSDENGPGGHKGNSWSKFEKFSKFPEELVTFATLKQRCENQGGEICPDHNVKSGFRADKSIAYSHLWTSTPCTPQVQVHSGGWINIVEPRWENTIGLDAFGVNSEEVFRVRWDDNSYPNRADGCPAACVDAERNTCLCNITVDSAAVFDAMPSTTAEIEENLFIGSPPPDHIGDGAQFELCNSDACNQNSKVKVYLKLPNAEFDEHTIFELRTGIRRKLVFLRNKASTVRVGAYSFRNPPHFMPLLGERLTGTGIYSNRGREQAASYAAEHEINALIDHIFEHPNVAPFLSKLLIQRLITSNPSPRYVKAVATAFRTGEFADHTYSGEYGDLGATFAAILLDPEARSTTLDADPGHGTLREPLLKVMHFFKSLEYKSHIGPSQQISFSQVGGVGQSPYGANTVFGFYLPDHRPPGPIDDMGLVSPEAQIAAAPQLVRYINGMYRTTLVGHIGWQDGFSAFMRSPVKKPWLNLERYRESADGELAYTPDTEGDIDAVIADLNLLLADGRMSEHSANELRRVHVASLDAGDAQDEALRRVLNLASAIPEFHTTNLNLPKGDRPKPEAESSNGHKFKAIVYIFLHGGADSFNMLIPHSNCPNNDLFAEYQNTRKHAALAKSLLLEIDVRPGSQPCNTFALHPALTQTQALYDAGDAAWVANVGNLIEPINNVEFNAKSKRKPKSLFSHAQQRQQVAVIQADNPGAKGIWGRAIKALMEQDPPYKSSLYTVGGSSNVLTGAPKVPVVIDSKRGIKRAAYGVQDLQELLKLKSSSVLAGTYADRVDNALRVTEELGAKFDATSLSTSFPGTDLGKQLATAAKAIKLSGELGTERAVFSAQLSGFDTHFDLDIIMDEKMAVLDGAIKAFKDEMVAQGVWDDVLVVTSSDFGRTLTANERGTDHGWGGHNVMYGGGLKGGQIFGKHPTSMSVDVDDVDNRGRLIPTTSWETFYEPIMEWFGVNEEKMAEVLPNLKNFPEHILKTDMFD